MAERGDGYGSRIDEAFCYITTIGRRTGRPHRIEIWFAGEPGSRTIYCLADGHEKADWVANLMVDPRVTVRVGDQEGAAMGRVVAPDTDEDPLARRLLLGKYQTPGSNDLERWSRTALPVAFDLSFAP